MNHHSSPRVRRGLGLRAATVAVAATTVVLAAAGVASAHVTVNPKTAEQGSFSKVEFRMPNEMNNATTDKLEVNLPIDHPIASVSVEPVYGWKATVVKSKLAQPIKSESGEITDAVTQITWTADANGKLQPGQFQDFGVSLGALPSDTTSLTFKALQTYSNGQVVRWIDVAQPGQPEPEHPAPVLTLTKPAPEGSQGSTAAPAAPAADTSATVSSASTQAASSDDSTARTLGIVGIIVGALGAAVGTGFGVYGMRRRGSAS